MIRLSALALLVLTTAALAAEPQVLFPEKRLVSPASVDAPFNLDAIPAGQQVRLSLKARLDWPGGFAGHNPFLAVRVNGQMVAPRQLANKPLEFTMYDGSDASWWGQGTWRLLYSPSFDEYFKADLPAYMVADADPYLFVWDITPYVKPGANTVTLVHPQILAQATTVVVADVKIEVGEPLPPPGSAAASGPAGGALPTYVPSRPQTVACKAELGSGGSLQVKVGKRLLRFMTLTGEPQGKWLPSTAEKLLALKPGVPATATWSGTGYRIKRVVTLRNDRLQVADTITNTTDKLHGVMLEHRLMTVGHEVPERLLCGRRVHKAAQTTASPGNPTALAMWPDLAVGLVADDDIFRVQGQSYTDKECVALQDQLLGFGPGASHTLEWSIYLLPRGDYWDFINAVRRVWDCKMTIPGPSLIEPQPDGHLTVEEYRQWRESRALRFAIAGQQALDNGILAEGTAIPLADKWNAGFRAWREKLKATDPKFQALLYLHSEISTEPDAQTKYQDCRVLDASGTQVVSPYHYPVYLFLPQPDNAYGKALTKTVEFMLDDLQADGIYNDCFTHDSAAWAWGLPWDGCTVSIDPQTHAVGQPYSSVVLLQQPWKVQFARMVHGRGKLLMGNGPLFTRTMLREKVPTFTETNSFAFLVDTHLSCPWGLGTHSNADQTEASRAYMARRMLDYAGVYSVYTWDKATSADPFIRYFFPLTPLELRAGVLIGEERILTNRSGRFGWGDTSRAEVHVFDAEGQAVPKPEVKEVREKGRVLTEVRVPPNGFAALVRKR